MSTPSGLTPGRRVLVVGGGIAGLSAIRALAQRGLSAALVDRAGGPPDAGLGLNLPGNVVTALRTLGVGEGLAACGTPLRRREYRNRGYLAAGPLVRAMRTLGEESVRDALTEGERPLRTVSGGVRFEDEYRYLIATCGR